MNAEEWEDHEPEAYRTDKIPMSDGSKGSSLSQLPPYWDGHWSKTWKSGGHNSNTEPGGLGSVYRPYMNPDEWEEAEPTAYRTDKTKMLDGSLSGLMQMQKSANLPPYWDGHYSDGWRYGHDANEERSGHPPMPRPLMNSNTHREETQGDEYKGYYDQSIHGLSQLPPYWDGHWSNTWRYGHDADETRSGHPPMPRPYMNSNEHREETQSD